MAKKNKVIQQLLSDSVCNVTTTKMCLTCQHSYFRPDAYDGYCKFSEGESPFSYMHLKSIDVYDVCDHWKLKKTK